MTMTGKKIDVTSTAVEKGLDIAKHFLDKLVMPTVEETGLLLRDRVTMWRFNNQVKMLNKAHAVCEKNGINPKKVSLKVLCPLLDYAGLEEDDVMQDKWAVLLANMVDSEQNIENHVFPYILSQISTNEFVALEAAIMSHRQRNEALVQELEELRKLRPEKEELLKENIIRIDKWLATRRTWRQEEWGKHQEKILLQRQLNELVERDRELLMSMDEPPYLGGELKDYEIGNLIRLGLVKAIQKTYGYIRSHSIKNNLISEYLSLEDAEVQIETEGEVHQCTDLGILFIQACTERKVERKN